MELSMLVPKEYRTTATHETDLAAI